MSRIFAVVGPSGAGKDTLMQAAAARVPSVHLARRVISRPQEAGGEVFDSVTESGFAARLERGDFALHWRAHGLSYGIPAALRDRLAPGETLLFNGSRAALPAAAAAFPGLKVIHVTARPEVRAARLARRGRETPEQIEERLDRGALELPEGLEVFEVDNSGDLQDAVDAVVRILRAPGA